MKTFIALLFVAGAMQQPATPDTLTLQDCYDRAAENYPLARNIELQEKIMKLNVQIAQTGYFPDVSLNGRASYQSEVTEFGLPGGGGAPAISKDQYEASLNISQAIFNGGATGIRKELERLAGEKEIQSIKVELHKIRSQIDQVYFGILLSQQQSEATRLFMEELEKRLQTVRSMVNNGAVLPSQQHILQAELIKARQDSARIRSNIRAGYAVLGELIGEGVPADTELSLPEIRADLPAMAPERPEYELFKTSEQLLDRQAQLAESRKLPGLSAFGTLGYGRPGYNFLNDDFHEYYMAGIRLRWNFTNFLNSEKEKQVLRIRRETVSQNRAAFDRQLNSTLERLNEEITTIRENLERDRQIISLREKIVEESASQLENGVITATDYITQLTRAQQARISLFTNRVRLARSRIEYATVLGVSPVGTEKMDE